MIGLLTNFAATCSGGGFFGLPSWYEYLQGTTDPTTGLCSPTISGLTDVWLIVAAIIEILLRVAALVAVGFVLYGGVKYIVSHIIVQPAPEALVQARRSIINALTGLVIAVVAAAAVQFIAGSIH